MPTDLYRRILAGFVGLENGRELRRIAGEKDNDDNSRRLEALGNRIHGLIAELDQIDCEYTDRIEVGIVSPFDQAIRDNAEYICGETLAVSLSTEPLEGVEAAEYSVAGETVEVYLVVVAASGLG